MFKDGKRNYCHLRVQERLFYLGDNWDGPLTKGLDLGFWCPHPVTSTQYFIFQSPPWLLCRSFETQLWWRTELLLSLLRTAALPSASPPVAWENRKQVIRANSLRAPSLGSAQIPSASCPAGSEDSGRGRFWSCTSDSFSFKPWWSPPEPRLCIPQRGWPGPPGLGSAMGSILHNDQVETDLGSRWT